MSYRFRQLFSILIGSVIVFAIAITIVRTALFVFSQNPALLTRQLSQSPDHSVTIGTLSARLHYFQPELQLEDVVISGQSGRKLQSIKKGLIRLRLLPLLMGKIKPSFLAIDNARFNLQINQNGKITVAGFDGDGDFLATMLSSGRYSLTNSEIGWSEQGNLDKPVIVHRLDAFAQSDNGCLELTVTANFPDQQGQLQLIANLTVDKQQSQIRSGNFHIKSTLLNLTNFRKLILKSLPVNDGMLNFNLWGQIKHSELNSLYGPINIDQIDWEPKPQIQNILAELPNHLHTAVWMEASSSGWQLVLNNVKTGQGMPLDGEGVAVEYVEHNNKNQQPEYRFKLSKLQLDKTIPLIVALSEKANIPDQQAKLLAATRLDGDLQNLSLFLQRNVDRLMWYACTDFSQLQIRYKTKITLQGGWSGHLCTNQHHATVDLKAGKSSIYLPEYYRNRLNLTTVRGQLRWMDSDQGWQLGSSKLRFSTDDMNIDLNFELQANNKTPWRLETSVDFDLSRAENLKRYLPSKLFKADVERWLSNVFRGGSLKQGHFSYQGLLVAEPFKNKAAVSKGYVRLDNTRIQFDPEEQWPQLSRFNADLRFENGLASMNVTSGNSLGVNIRDTTIIINDLAELDHVYIHTNLDTSLQLAENYILNSLLEQKIGDFVHYLHPHGESRYTLDFMVPLLSETDQFWISGKVDLIDAVIKLSDIDLTINDVNGQLQFTEDTVTADALQAVVENQPIQVDILDNSDHIAVKSGFMLGSQFIHHRWSWLKPLQGNTDVKVDVLIAKNNEPEESTDVTFNEIINVSQPTDITIKIHSDLQGMGVDLPEPLGKPVSQNKNLAVDIHVNDSQHVPIEIHYGKDMHADIALQKKMLDEWQLESAHLMIGKGYLPANDDIKYSLSAHLPMWDLRELQSIQTLNSSLTFEKRADHSNKTKTQQAEIELDIEIDRLTLNEAKLGSVSLILNRKNSEWRGFVDGSIAKGTVNYKPAGINTKNKTSQQRGNLNLTLDYFTLVNIDRLGEIDLLMSNHPSYEISPRHIPTMLLSVDKVVWGDLDLGQMKLDTSAVKDGLSIDTFSVNGAEHHLTTKGHWISQQTSMETVLQGSLKSKNLAHFLHHFGIYEDIRKTAATIDFDLNWRSSPFKIDWPSLKGKVSLALEHGRLLGIEPGIGRALGLFSLSAWERRLRFDFSDIVDDGFAYDRVTADFALYNGNAYSANLEIDGVAARVLFAGRIGLVKKDIDGAVTVIPRSSIALPLAGAAGGPIGLGAGLVIQQLVGDEFDTLSSSEYSITGSWTDPRVTLVPENGGIFSRMLWKIQKMTGTDGLENQQSNVIQAVPEKIKIPHHEGLQ